jgi:hypothetical protein
MFLRRRPLLRAGMLAGTAYAAHEAGERSVERRLEHRWAIPLRAAIERAGGKPIADAWVTPEDLAGLGLPA